MAKWRVWANSSQKLYLDVEANTEEEAWEIAEMADGGEFTEDSLYSHWETERPYRIYETVYNLKVGDRVKVISNPMIKKVLWEATGMVSYANENDKCVTIDFDKKNLAVFNKTPFWTGYVVSEDAK